MGFQGARYTWAPKHSRYVYVQVGRRGGLDLVRILRSSVGWIVDCIVRTAGRCHTATLHVLVNDEFCGAQHSPWTLLILHAQQPSKARPFSKDNIERLGVQISIQALGAPGPGMIRQSTGHHRPGCPAGQLACR